MVKFLYDNLFRRNQKDEQITTMLAENFIFKTLSKVELHFVKQLVHLRSFRPGEAIFEQGEMGVGMFIIAKGTVNITVEDLQQTDDNREVFVTRLARGDFFGEIGILNLDGGVNRAVSSTKNVSIMQFYSI